MKLIFTLTIFSLSFSQILLDGKNFDSGAEMTEASKFAPKGSDALLAMLGAWEIEESVYRNDSVIAKRSGHSLIQFNNRGHSYIERSYIYNVFNDGSDEYTISLFAKSKRVGNWGKGVVSDYKENVQIFDGNFDGKALVLYDAPRYQGGMMYTVERLSYSLGKNKFSFVFEESKDHGKSFTKKLRRVYTKSKKAHKMFNFRDDYGKANPARVSEATDFDFLIGEAISSHSMTLPTGQNVKFPANATAVQVLNGKAILEFNTIDVDRSLPDAATTIIRIYNRSMRRWDNLFLNNRSNSLYFFGGAKEGDKIILHNFTDNRGLGSMSRFVFYNVQENSDYDWYGETSRDGGKNFVRFWEIEIRKK